MVFQPFLSMVCSEHILKILMCVINNPTVISYPVTIIIIKVGYIITSTFIGDIYVEEYCIGIALIESIDS